MLTEQTSTTIVKISPMRLTHPATALIAVHLLMGLLLGWLATDDLWNIPLMVFCALVLCQTSLLGIWGALGSQPWSVRLLGVSLGVPYLGSQFGFSIDEFEWDVVLLVVMATLLVFASLVIVRCCGIQLLRFDEKPRSSEALQFSILHLMVLTFVVACLITVGKVLQSSGVRNAGLLMFVFTVGFCFAVGGVMAVWAMLGTGKPWVRSIVCIALAAVAGCLPPMLENDPIAAWIAMTVLQSLFLLASLYYLRISGYRLFRIHEAAK